MIHREQGLSKSTAILTASGERFDYAAPRASDVRLGDIIESLSKTCRFRGMCPGFYSVAEHSVVVMQAVGVLWLESQGNPAPESALWAALMHDAAEAYTGDAPTPMKRAMGPAWTDFERRIEAVVREALEIDSVAPIVKEADGVAYKMERRFIYGWDDVVLPSAIERALLEGRMRVPFGLEREAARVLFRGRVASMPTGARLLRAEVSR